MYLNVVSACVVQQQSDRSFNGNHHSLLEQPTDSRSVTNRASSQWSESIRVRVLQGLRSPDWSAFFLVLKDFYLLNKVHSFQSISQENIQGDKLIRLFFFFGGFEIRNVSRMFLYLSQVKSFLHYPSHFSFFFSCHQISWKKCKKSVFPCFGGF